MPSTSYTVTGVVTDENTVKLDESLPIHLAKVRVTIEPLDAPKPNRYPVVMAEIRQRQKERNHRPLSPTEIEEYLSKERDSWE